MTFDAHEFIPEYEPIGSEEEIQAIYLDGEHYPNGRPKADPEAEATATPEEYKTGMNSASVLSAMRARKSR